MIGVAFLFPGQGSQHPGMGLDLARAFPESRRVFDIADEVLGEPLSRLCFEGPAEALAQTEHTQPALLTASVAAHAAVASRGVVPVAAAGHSLGEYSAHVVAQTLEFSAALRAVRARGRFMQEAVPQGRGAMAAILGLDVTTVADVCARAAQGEVVEPANFNEPRQTVIAGHTAAVERATELARAAGARRAVRLAVSAPFHSSLMRPAAERLAPVLGAIPFSTPRVPVWANFDARPVQDAASARDALLRQVAAPVRWQAIVEGLAAAGIQHFVELGPGRVLSGLVSRSVPAARVWSVADAAGVERVVAELGRVRA